MTHPARAQDATESEWFRVTRAPGTESCPDAQRLQSAVSALLDHSPGKPSAPLQIDFQASGGRFVARLVPSDPRARAREFADRHPDCEPLERAVVTALALYLDATHPAADSPTAEPASQSEVPPSAAAPAASSSAASASTDQPGDDTQPQEAGGRLTAGLGGGLLVGLGVPAAPAVRAELGYRWSRWHAQATALWLPGTTNEVP
ncbi:MAG TPA: hypothetical protein VLC09_10885, partial [Polyangiaceae bacterium]|nr:hypothetical protein [Polyangiaceae bacterium]